MKERNLTVPVTIHMPLKELDSIEAAAAEAKLSRASWCKRALRAALGPLADAQPSEADHA